jgi:hypothetical protein
MRGILAVAIVAMAIFGSPVAFAQERAGDAALGALSGAVVLGPVGAVAGAIVGFTAGPSIARSWGLRGERARPARSVKAPARSARVTSGKAPPPAARAQASTAPAQAPRAPAQAGPRAQSMPPPQTFE